MILGKKYSIKESGRYVDFVTIPNTPQNGSQTNYGPIIPYVINSNTYIELDMCTSTYKGGIYIGGNPESYSVFNDNTDLRFFAAGSPDNFYCDVGSGRNSISFTSIQSRFFNKQVKVHLDFKNRIISVGDMLQLNIPSNSIPVYSYITIGKGVASFNNGGELMMIFECLVKEGSDVKLDLLPYIDNNKIYCLKDKTSGNMYYCQGGRDFTHEDLRT